MKRMVAYILGTAYSGSSLLNLLLDSYRGVRGLGEAVNLLNLQTKAHCGRCRLPAPRCPLYAAVRRDGLYQSLFDFYGDCDVLVDSSKAVATCLRMHAFERQFDHRILLLSKSPHEFAYSYRGHHPETTPAAAFRIYIDFYRGQLVQLERETWLKPWDCLSVCYRELATRTERKLAQISDFLGLSHYVRNARFASDSHIIGGNWMVAAQTEANGDRFSQVSGYLRGKYAGKYRTVFCDQQWQTDPVFAAQCVPAYEAAATELGPLLERLGQPDCQQLMSCLRVALGTA